MFNYKRAKKAEKRLEEVEYLIKDYLDEIGALSSRSFFLPPSYYLRELVAKTKERRAQAARETEIRQVIDKHLSERRDGA